MSYGWLAGTAFCLALLVFSLMNLHGIERVRNAGDIPNIKRKTHAAYALYATLSSLALFSLGYCVFGLAAEWLVRS